MDPLIGGALISGASNVLGSLFGSKPDVKHDSAHGETEGSINAKMEAAKKYGISPLYMLGAPAVSGQSTVVGGGSELGSALAGMGQDVGRAVAAQQTAAQREATRLALEGAQLDNDLKRSTLVKLTTGVPPPMPIDGGGVSGDVGLRPDTIIGGDADVITVDKGVTPSQVVQNEYGDWAENIEGMLHYISDKFVRPGNAWARSHFGAPFNGTDPWQAGAKDAVAVRGMVKALLGALRKGNPYMSRPRKRYYDRIPPSYTSGW